MSSPQESFLTIYVDNYNNDTYGSNNDLTPRERFWERSLSFFLSKI